MALMWRVWVICVLVLVCGSCGLEGGSDRWVWRRSARVENRKASSIPGYVEPDTNDPRTANNPRTTNPTTQTPSITTYRPSRPDRSSLRGLGRGTPRTTRQFQRITSHPFFLGSFPPFSLVPISPQNPTNDGTTKSRAPVDTVFDGAVLDVGDKYTTLDRLQQERGPLPPLPRPQKHQLGGLHPDEVFYADDDLLIIKGGGFNSNIFQEPSQTLDDDDDDREGSPSILSPVALPSPHDEYNGNIPAIVPPPATQHQPFSSTQQSPQQPFSPSHSISSTSLSPQHPFSPSHQSPEHPFSLFVEAASDNDYILVPYVMPRQALVPSSAPPGTVTNRLDDNNNKRSTRPHYYYYTPPAHPATFLTRPAAFTHYNTQVNMHKNGLTSPPHSPVPLHHSLVGDTDVNFLPPLPKVNPDAETFIPKQQQQQQQQQQQHTTTPQRHVPDRHIPERHIPGRYPPERQVPERNIPKRQIPGRYPPERHIPERQIPGRYPTERHVPERHIPERHIPGRYTPERYVPGRTTQRQHGKPRV